MASVALTPEIIQHIIFYLIHDVINPLNWILRPDAPQYAAVNCIWQDLVERYTFAKLYLNADRLANVNSIVTPRRRSYVHDIVLDIVLPGVWLSPNPETDEEKLRNNCALQATFEAFMQSVSQWKPIEIHPKGVRLTFEPRESGFEAFDEKRHDFHQYWIRRVLSEREYKRSVLDLTNPERIAQYPPIVAIVEVDMKYPEQDRYISPMAICALLERFPSAKHASINWQNSIKSAAFRENIANALSQIDHTMDTFEILDSRFVLKHRAQSSSREEDELSKSLRILSQGLISIVVEDIIISDEIFWPRSYSMGNGINLPKWDRLVDFIVTYPPLTPSGEWLFLPDPSKDIIESSGSEASSSDEEASDIRSLGVASPAMRRFYISAANAALQMPRLQHMMLLAQLDEIDQGNWHKFRYYTKDPTPFALWTSSSGYIPEDDVLESWRKVPRLNLVKELEVQLSDDRHAVQENI